MDSAIVVNLEESPHAKDVVGANLAGFSIMIDTELFNHFADLKILNRISKAMSEISG